MTLPITSIYAIVLTIMMIALSTIVSSKRGRSGISILHGDNMDLALAIRRHGNFIENVPMALLLLALAEMNAAPPLLLHAAGAALVIGRIAHVAGLSADNPFAPLRIAGGVLTTLCMIAAIGFVGWKSIG